MCEEPEVGVREWLFFLPLIAGRQAQIIILEILNAWMPVPLYLSGVVITFAFLDLEKYIILRRPPEAVTYDSI